MFKKSCTLLTAVVAVAAAALEVGDKPMVLSHYVPWHVPQNGAITVCRYINYPLLRGALGGNEALKRELALAQKQGIDGFSVDIVAHQDGATAYINNIGAMLKAAEGTDFCVMPCLDVKTDVPQQIAALKYVMQNFSGHPNYPKVNGKPVVMTYTWAAWTPEEWRAIREGLSKEGCDIYLVANLGSGYAKKDPAKIKEYASCFDMAYSFGEHGLDGKGARSNLDLMAKTVKDSGRDWCASLTPGYYGAWVDGRNDFYQPHLGFDQFHTGFAAMVPGRDKWMHFTTWNDHDETSILPMPFTSGNARITKAYSDAFKKIAPPAEIQLLLAYHREEQPGTLLRIELMTLPSAQGQTVTVQGKLLGLDGKEVCRLPAKTMSTKDFDRTEYLIPTAGLAVTPVLTPVIELSYGKVKEERTFMPVLLKSGGLYNAVTVKIALNDLAPTFADQLTVTQKGQLLQAKITFAAPDQIKYATLFRNDLPLADFSAQAPTLPLMNLLVDFSQNVANYSISIIGDGEFVRGTRMFAAPDSPKFTVTAKLVTSVKNVSWEQAGFLLSVSPGATLKIECAGAEPVLMSVQELTDRKLVTAGPIKLVMSQASPTVLNAPELNLAKGELSLTLFSRGSRVDDAFFVRYELAAGRVGFSPVSLPFETRKPYVASILSTAETLETSSDATGCPGNYEFLTPKEQLPLSGNVVSENTVHPATVRFSRWTFERDGFDELGEQSARTSKWSWAIPGEMLARNEGFNGQTALKLDGSKTFKMALRSLPVGAFTYDFYLKPDEVNPAGQSVIYRSGWSNAVAVNLDKDNKIELVRDGNNRQPIEKLAGKTPLVPGKWARVRVTCDEKELKLYLDGKLDAETTVAPARSYGNCIWYLGGGAKGKANFKGLIDDVTIAGQAFAPGDGNFPADSTVKALPPVKSMFDLNMSEVKPVKTVWESANFELVSGALTQNAPNTENQAKPQAVYNDDGIMLLAGPGSSHRGGAVILKDVTLEEGQEINIPLKRYLISDSPKGWTALEVKLSNVDNCNFAFNFGRPGEFMITESNPKWNIRSGKITFDLPGTVTFRRQNGYLILRANGKNVYTAANPADKPYNQLQLSLILQNPADAVLAEFGQITMGK